MNVTGTEGTLVTAYTGLGAWMGLATGNPGSTSSPASEATGGSPAYARQETSWSVSGASALGTSVTFHVPAGTYSYMLFCSAASGNNMVDWTAIPPQVCASPTTITIVPLATAS